MEIGVDVTLIEKDMIEPCGKLDAPGRPTLYRTTTDFLRVFGLGALEELPAVRLKTETGENIEIVPGQSFLADPVLSPEEEEKADGEQTDESGTEERESAD